MFLAAAISAGCYYCMWSGFGVNKKLDSAGQTRMVFFGHFVDRIFSMPLIIYSLCLVANAEMGEIVLLLGLDFLMVGCVAIGAAQLHPWKWIWYFPHPSESPTSQCPALVVRFLSLSPSLAASHAPFSHSLGKS